MPEEIVTKQPPRGRKILAFVAVVVLALGLIGGAVAFLARQDLVASTADLSGAPLRLVTADGDRVFVLTSQWKTYRRRYGGSGRGSSGYSVTYTDLLVDLWAFDAADARPLWRRRVLQERKAVNSGRTLLGAQGGAIWVLDGKRLSGFSPKDGAPVADAAAIEAANPALRGLIPTEAQYYHFDTAGLSFWAADGRAWRLAGPGLRFVTAPERPQPTPDAIRPARIAGGVGTYAFYERGLDIGRRWLGLLDEAEARTFLANKVIGGIDPSGHPRVRLWSAEIVQRQTFFGPRTEYVNFAPLPESPEFLHAGLLSENRTDQPIILRQPDSVLVLHRDRLGKGGHLQLTRIAGPAGRVVWTADLPTEALEAVLPGQDSIVLYGRREEPRNLRRADDPNTVSVGQLVSVDLATGKVGAYGFRLKPTAAEDIPPSSTRPDRKR